MALIFLENCPIFFATYGRTRGGEAMNYRLASNHLAGRVPSSSVKLAGGG